jgi:hypothetical protein
MPRETSCHKITLHDICTGQRQIHDGNVKNHNKEGIIFTMYVLSVLISGQRQKVNISISFCGYKDCLINFY